MACRLFIRTNARLLLIKPLGTNFNEIRNQIQQIPLKKMHSEMLSAKWQSFSFGINVYHKTSNISRTLVGNKIVDHSDVVGASPVGAAPTTSSFST